MPKNRKMPAFKVQVLNFDFKQAGEKLSDRLETDERYQAIHSLKVLSGFYPVPTTIRYFAIDDDAKLFDEGLYLSFFQNLDNESFRLDYLLSKPESEIKVELIDTSNPASFVPYSVQIALVLTRVYEENP